MRLGITVAAAVIGLSGCLGDRRDEEPAPPEFLICPSEPPSVTLADGAVVLCPGQDDVQFSTGKEAVAAYLRCEAVVRAWEAAFEACVEDLRGLEP